MNPPYTCPETVPDCCLASSTSGCWDLTADSNRFQVDDDNSQTDELTGVLAPVIIPEEPATPAAQFQPSGGLAICNILDAAANCCNEPALDETLDTYFHINPPLGLATGDYETGITIELI